MLSRSLAFLVWALVAGSAVVWGLKLFAPAQPVPPQAVVASPSPATGGDLSRLFGVFAPPPPPPSAAVEAAPPPPEASRFQLIGVVAAVPAAPRSQGVALIAVDGKPARAYRVGAVIDGEHVLQDVRAREVAIGPRGQPTAIALELPPLPAPATGVPGGGGGAGPMVLPLPGAMAPVMAPAVQPALPGTLPNIGPAAQARLRAMSASTPTMMLPRVPAQLVPQGQPMPAADPTLPEVVTPHDPRATR